MVAYELLVSMGADVMFMIDGSEFSVVQVSTPAMPSYTPAGVFLTDLQCLVGMLTCQAFLSCNRAW